MKRKFNKCPYKISNQIFSNVCSWMDQKNDLRLLILQENYEQYSHLNEQIKTDTVSITFVCLYGKSSLLHNIFRWK